MQEWNLLKVSNPKPSLDKNKVTKKELNLHLRHQEQSGAGEEKHNNNNGHLAHPTCNSSKCIHLFFSPDHFDEKDSVVSSKHMHTMAKKRREKRGKKEEEILSFTVTQLMFTFQYEIC